MVIRTSFSSLICATAFIIYFLYILLFGFNLFENDYFLLSASSGLIPPLDNCSNKPKISRLTKKEQSEYTIPKNLEQILVGLLLGDLWADRRGDNTRFRFKQGICHKDYLIHLYELFKDFCPQVPRTVTSLPHKKTGNVYETILFTTYSLPCFSVFCKPFYLPSGDKIIPNNIGDLLTPLGLCYLISDDGGFCQKSRRVTLATNCFSLEQVQLFAQVLKNKFNLICYVNKLGNDHVIRISSKSLPVLQELLKDKMPSMMLYKLGL